MLREAATGPGDRRPARATPATTVRRSRPGSTRPAASPSRRTATSTSPTRTTTSSAASTRATRRSSRSPATTSSAPASRATTVRPPTRSSTRRTASRSRPDGDLIVADSHNDRIRRVDRPTRIITTIAGSGENGYDGDDKPATEAALNTPSAVAAAPNGDIYIADTLNYRVRMIDATTGLDPHRRRRRHARRRRRPSATAARRPART